MMTPHEKFELTLLAIKRSYVAARQTKNDLPKLLAGPTVSAEAIRKCRDAQNLLDQRLGWYTAATHNEVHEGVWEMLKKHHPLDMHQPALEYPHPGDSDGLTVIFRASDEQWQKKPTTMRLGRYLRRHFPDVSDAELHAVVQKHTYHSEYFITEDLDRMVHLVKSMEVYSCMKNFGNEYHPYRAYHPEHGWALAVRTRNGKPWARALVHLPTKTFVRSYSPVKSTKLKSVPDDLLDNWLEEQGFSYEPSWPYGVKLSVIDGGAADSYVTPYVDGDSADFNLVKPYHWVHSADGEIALQGDEGVVTLHKCCSCDSLAYHSNQTAADAGAAEREDGVYCESCADTLTEAVVGRSNGRWRYDYVDDSDLAETIDVDESFSQAAAERYLVQIDCGEHEGKYTYSENVIEDTDGDHWHINDTDSLRQLTAGIHESEWAYEPKTWVCCVSGYTYHEDDEYVDTPDGRCAAEHAPDEAEDEAEEAAET